MLMCLCVHSAHNFLWTLGCDSLVSRMNTHRTRKIWRDFRKREFDQIHLTRFTFQRFAVFSVKENPMSRKK